MGATASAPIEGSRQHARQRLAAALPELKRRGFDLLAIDFDMTILDCHTGGSAAMAGLGGAEELAAHVRPLFTAVLAAAPGSGLAVAVVTFSAEVELIRRVLQLAVGAAAAEGVIIRGTDGLWDVGASAARATERLG